MNPEIPGEEIPGASGNHPERHVGAHESRRGLHRGAVAPEYGDDIDPLRDAVLRKAPCVAGATGRQHLGIPSRALQRPHDLRDRIVTSARGRRIRDHQDAGHQNSRSQRMSRPIW